MADNERTYDFSLKNLNSSNQTTKIKKHQLQVNEVTKIPPKISKIHFVSQNEGKKISGEKQDHQSLLKLKKDIQSLIDFKSPRIGLIEMPTTEFSKHVQMSQNFQLITLDGEPIPEIMLSKKCKQVRARGRMTATPIVRHLKQHAKIEMERKVYNMKKVDKKNNGIVDARSLSQSKKIYVPNPLAAQTFGHNLSPAQSQEEENRISSQISLLEVENNPCPHSKENLITCSIPEAINTYGSINVRPKKMVEFGGTESYHWIVL